MLWVWHRLGYRIAAVLAVLMPFYAHAAPGQSALSNRGDWVYGCDNALHCDAIALLPKNPATGFNTLKLSRARGDGSFFIQIKGLPNTADRYQIYIDNRLADTGAIDSNSGTATINNADALKLGRLLARGRSLSIRDASGAVLGQISLTGSTAALRAIDMRQGRKGTKSAIIATGRKQRLKARVIMPDIVARRIIPSPDLPDAVSLVALAENSACAKKRSDVSQDAAYSLGNKDGKALALVLLNCGAGPFNVYSVALLAVQQGDKNWKFDPVQFDSQFGFSIEGAHQLLVNPVWDQASQTLVTRKLLRATGDCGEFGKFIWDGAAFRLILSEAMGQCRGARDWITVSRATVKMQD